MLTVRLVTDADEVVADIAWTTAEAKPALHAEGGWEVIARADRDLLLKLDDQDQNFWCLLIDHSTGITHGGLLWDWEVDGVGSDATLKMWGGDPNWYMNTTITLPDVAVTNYPGIPARSKFAYDRVSQFASRSLYELVDDQVNNTTLPYRTIGVSLLLAALQNFGRQLALESMPFEPLLDTVKSWSERGGIVTNFQFKGTTSTPEMVMRSPIRRTFRLSEQDGVLVDWKYRRTGHKVNYPWMGGKGEGVDRQVAPVAPLSFEPRYGVNIERFVKASSAVDDVALIASGRQAIEKNQATQEVATKALASRMGVEYGVGYFLGDIVPIVFLGIEHLRFVTAVTLSWTVEGKSESLSMGLPDIDILDIDFDMGRQALVDYRPTAGLAVGDLRLVETFDAGDGTVRFAVELVYVEADGNGADQAGISIEYRVDGGAWVADLDDLKTGNLDYFYDLDTWTFTRNVPAYTQTLEYRASLAKTGETTVFTPILFLSDISAPPGQPAGFVAQQAGDAAAANLSWDTPIDAGVPAATSFVVRYRSGVTAWAETAVALNPSSGSLTFSDIDFDPGETWEFQLRFVNTEGDGPWSASASVTFAQAVTGSYFTTGDGGYFTTGDGGYFTTES